MTQEHSDKLRFYCIVIILLVGLVTIVIRMVDLTIFDQAFLQKQGNARVLRTVTIPAFRGMILDRNNKPLAISVPVDSIWMNPKEFKPIIKQLNQLSTQLKISNKVMQQLAKNNRTREFVYLRRGLAPSRAEHILGLKITGIYKRREYRRFYPEGEVTAQVLGFTNIDDQGQEGLELAYNKWLHGISGKRRVLKDRLGHIVADIDIIRPPQPGHNLVLSMDRQIQYLAYRALKRAVNQNKAKSGSVVVLDVKTGEILAMVNQPSYNPNNRPDIAAGRFRNRAVTDVFEPGSVIKAFSVVSALDSGKYTPTSEINTAPGWLMVDGNTVRDEHNNGELTLTQILQRSSNVGVTKVTLSLPPQQLWGLLHRVGFGERTGSGFPGEAIGSLVDHRVWRPFVLATLAFGYGISVTPLQLAHAYEVIADNGMKVPVTFLKREAPPVGIQVIAPKVAHEMIDMLETVVERGGTGTRARVRGYHVAGKTGTARIAGVNGYEKNHHIASFVGIAPATHPTLVVAVMIRDPQHGQYYGGLVAAPVFSKVMAGALRILDVPPDNIKART